MHQPTGLESIMSAPIRYEPEYMNLLWVNLWRYILTEMTMTM